MYLNNVNYSSEKRQITVEFSGSDSRASKKYLFFPKTHYVLGKISKENFLEVVSSCDLKRIKTDFFGDTAVVFAATFADLKKINNLVANVFGEHNNLIEPERQFLIGKNWSYFDCFSISRSEPEKIPSIAFPDASLDFLSDSLKHTIDDLFISNRSLARDFVKKIVFSNLSRVPLAECAINKSVEDFFLENILFASSKPVPLERKQSLSKAVPTKGFSEIDFSKLAAIVSAKPFHNIGFESINCTCCKPNSLEDKNVLLSSLVRVRFLREAFYFNSASKNWAKQFHFANQFKAEREKRKKEYFSDFFPVGPFSRNQEEDILFKDALSLAEKGAVKILGSKEFSWCCLQEESFLSKEINMVREKLASTIKLLEKETSFVVASKGLFFAQEIESKPDFFYWKIMKKSLSKILSKIPDLLSNPESRFFFAEVAVPLEVIFAGISEDFNGVALEEGTFLRNFSSKTVIDSFSAQRISRKISDFYGVSPDLVSLKTPL